MAHRQGVFNTEHYLQNPGYINPADAIIADTEAGASDMSRSDSGYYSNNPLAYQGCPGACDPVFLGREEDQEECLPNSQAFGYWGLQHHAFNMDTTSQEPQQDSDYILGYTGDQMMDQYLSQSTPRTAHLMMGGAYGAEQDPDQSMDLDSPSVSFTRQEARSGWSLDTATPHEYAQPQFQLASAFAPCEREDSVIASQCSWHPSPTADPCLEPGPYSYTIHDDSHQHHRLQPGQDKPASGQVEIATTTTTTPGSRFPCHHMDCTRQFNRAADLDRHHKLVHCKDQAKALLCDWRKCPRHNTPFHRPDHFRDHLRESHREDLPKRGSGNELTLKAWWKTRLSAAVYGGWWRCTKCLVRVSIEEHDYRCPTCGSYCEVERQAMRKLPVACEYPECAVRLDGQSFKNPARFREHLRDLHGEDVPKNEGRYGQAELQSGVWWGSRNPACVYSDAWRCTRCLEWVDGEDHGWECPRCSFGCEEIRRVYRSGTSESQASA